VPCAHALPDGHTLCRHDAQLQFHCELAAIERCWMYCKRITRAACGCSIITLRSVLPQVCAARINSVFGCWRRRRSCAQALAALAEDRDFIVRQFNKTRRYIRLYSTGLSGPQAQATEVADSQQRRTAVARTEAAAARKALDGIVGEKHTHRQPSVRSDAYVESLKVQCHVSL